MKNIKEFIKLSLIADKIRNSEIKWERKFDLIFSVKISMRIEQLQISIDYYDPDCSYEDDVNAYVDAIVEVSNELQSLIM